MSQLYTTLVMVKRSLNDGRLPPMTPIPEEIRHIINPEYVPGLGAMNEEDGKGLQCPVCGIWRHRLAPHLNTAHADHGGAVGIKRLLGIPRTCGLQSQTLSALMAEKARLSDPYGERLKKWRAKAGRAAASGLRGKQPPRGSGATLTIGERNLRDTCHAQIGHRLWDVRNRLGRSPTTTEVRSMDKGLEQACSDFYGTFNAAKASHGLDCTSQGYAPLGADEVVACLSAWVEAHGSLPTQNRRRRRLPHVPTTDTVRRALKADSWKGAMRKAAIRLGIYDSRYRPEPGSTITSNEAASRLGISSGQLANLRYMGKGPPYTKVGQLVRYSPADVDAFLA